LALLVRHEANGLPLRAYRHRQLPLSNASTYEDCGLFTADEDIAADVADVFTAVTGLSRPAVFRKLLVGPWFLRDGSCRRSNVSAAARGEPARSA
jgi:polyphosphate kinase